MVRVIFEGVFHLHNGDKVEILRGIRTGDSVRACQARNVTEGSGIQKSRIDGILMTLTKEEFSPSITGKVTSIDYHNAGATVEFSLVSGDDLNASTLEGTGRGVEISHNRVNGNSEHCEYDVSISYASEDAKVAENLENGLRSKGIKVFLDRRKRHELWGKDLGEYFEQVFGKKSVFALVLLSEHYVKKEWTDYEFECAKKEAEKRRGEFILPIRLDNAIKPGLKSTIGYMDYRKDGPDSIIVELMRKLEESPRSHLSGDRSKGHPEPPHSGSDSETRDDGLGLEWKDAVCLEEPFEVEPGGYTLVPLNLQAKDRMAGTLDEAEGDAFNWYIVDENNMVEFKRKNDFRYEKGGEGEGAYRIRRWSVPKNGPWYLILSAHGKQYPREITVRMRKRQNP